MPPPPRDRGASAVEFALVLPILLLLVIGILEFGRAYHVQTTLSNAARDGVRVMALQDSAAAAKTRVAKSAPTLGITTDMITVEVDPSSACSGAGSVPNSTASVTVEYPLALLSGILPIDDLTLTGKGTMRCNG
jgi:Flp pilus assembly protein TadG